MTDARISEQIEQVDRDLAEIDGQLEVGDLDEATAERLRSAYQAERVTLQEQLAETQTTEPPSSVSTKVVTTPEGRSKGRAIVGTAIVGIAAVVVAVTAMLSLQEQTPAGEMTDGIATAVLEDGRLGDPGATDLSSISAAEMEAVVAENPNIAGMRMALAELYVEEGNLPKALEHYMIVLEVEPGNPEALTRVGWLTSVSGEPGLAVPFFEQALAIEPDYPQAYWFLANARIDIGDKEGAIGPLEALLTYEIPTEVRTEALAMLEEARS